MRIGIITQPLRNNYGGILQNYALQQILKKYGHEVITLDQTSAPVSRCRIFASYIKTFILKLIGKGTDRKYYSQLGKKQEAIIRQHTKYFVDKYIVHTQPMFKSEDFRNFCINNKIDLLITGSDQVWRPIYNYNIYRSFFDFAEGLNLKRIAYAASFGVDTWEFSEEQTLECKRLIEKFDFISVREESGIDLCEGYFNRSAEHVLDPTILLDKEDYERLVYEENEPVSPGNLFTYILDESDEKREIIKKVADSLNLVPFNVMPKCYDNRNTIKQIEDCIYPPVTRWLRAFMDAKFVVCDSFHGAVFSIIFNKPFLIIANKKRGMARFNSLLNNFDLNDRIIDNAFNVELLLKVNICWEQVNKSRVTLRDRSIKYLKDKVL